MRHTSLWLSQVLWLWDSYTEEIIGNAQRFTEGRSTWLLAAFYFSLATGLKASVPCRLWPGACPLGLSRGWLWIAAGLQDDQARETQKEFEQNGSHCLSQPHLGSDKRTQMKINRGKSRIRQGWEPPRCRASGCPLHGEWWSLCLFLLVMRCDKVREVLPSTEAHPSVHVLSFIVTLTQWYDWPSIWLTLASHHLQSLKRCHIT